MERDIFLNQVSYFFYYKILLPICIHEMLCEKRCPLGMHFINLIKSSSWAWSDRGEVKKILEETKPITLEIKLDETLITWSKKGAIIKVPYISKSSSINHAKVDKSKKWRRNFIWGHGMDLKYHLHEDELGTTIIELKSWSWYSVIFFFIRIVLISKTIRTPNEMDALALY